MSFRLALLAMLSFGVVTSAADLGKVERSIGKEPKYRGQPKYGLLVFGPEAKDRVWLVQDGDTLYVDRNGNGDLTDAGEKIVAKIDKSFDPKEYGYSFEVGDLSVGGRVHKSLIVHLPPLASYVSLPDFADFKPLKDALKADPKAVGTIIRLDVDSQRLKGGGDGGRLTTMVGFHDGNGVLQLASRPDAAPIIHLDGPLQATLYGPAPRVRLARDNDIVLTVGTPGHGPGTFAMVVYQDAIPENAHPRLEIEWPAEKPGAPPVKQLFELKHRC